MDRGYHFFSTIFDNILEQVGTATFPCSKNIEEQGNVIQDINSGKERQISVFNRLGDGPIDDIPNTLHQLSFQRFEDGTCIIRSYGHLGSSLRGFVNMWIKLSSEDMTYQKTITMKSTYLYGPVYSSALECPKTDKFHAEFAFDMGSNFSLNNHGNNYHIYFPDLN